MVFFRIVQIYILLEDFKEKLIVFYPYNVTYKTYVKFYDSNDLNPIIEVINKNHWLIIWTSTIITCHTGTNNELFFILSADTCLLPCERQIFIGVFFNLIYLFFVSWFWCASISEKFMEKFTIKKILLWKKKNFFPGRALD